MATMNISIPDQEARDKRETLIRALESGASSGVSKRTLNDIWKEVKTRNR